MATQSHSLQRFTSRSTPTRLTTVPNSYLDQVDRIGDHPLCDADSEYSSRREAQYRADMDYDYSSSATGASTPSRPDSGRVTEDDASSVYSTNDAIDPVEEPSAYSCSNTNEAAQGYDVSDLQEAFGMSATAVSPEATMQEVVSTPVEPPCPRAEDPVNDAPCQAGPSRPQTWASSDPASREDVVHEAPSAPKSSKSKEGHGVENPDAVPTAGGMRLGANAKNWVSWQERLVKQREESWMLEHAMKEAKEAEKAEGAAMAKVEDEKSPKSKSMTSLLKRFKGMRGQRSNSKQGCEDAWSMLAQLVVERS